MLVLLGCRPDKVELEVLKNNPDEIKEKNGTQTISHSHGRKRLYYLYPTYVSEFQIFQLKNHQSTKHFHDKVIDVTM